MEDLRNNTKIPFSYFILFSLLLLSLNLRAPLTTASILREIISSDLGLSDTQSGFMMTVPLIAFAISSVFISNVGIKFGYTRAVICSCILLMIGEIIRLNFDYTGLIIGTGIIGLGISFGNVLIPSIIKLKFPDNLGVVTGLYSVVMGVFSAISTGVCLYIATEKGIYWKNILSIWVVLSTITLLIWLIHLVVRKDSMMSCADRRNIFERKEIFKSKTAWAIITYMGMQSFMFYTTITWLPKILILKGFESSFSGFMITLFQISAVPFSLFIPIIATKMKNQKTIAVFVALGYLLGYVFLYFATKQYQVIMSIVVMAIGSSGTYSAAIILMELRSRTSTTVAIISGLSQSIGYLLASVGPVLLGILFDKYDKIDGPVAVLVFIASILVISGIRAGKEGYIDDEGVN